jgi:hypothetical protein
MLECVQKYKNVWAQLDEAKNAQQIHDEVRECDRVFCFDHALCAVLACMRSRPLEGEVGTQFSTCTWGGGGGDREN